MVTVDPVQTFNEEDLFKEESESLLRGNDVAKDPGGTTESADDEDNESVAVMAARFSAGDNFDSSRRLVRALVRSHLFESVIIIVVVVNAVVLGLETDLRATTQEQVSGTHSNNPMIFVHRITEESEIIFTVLFSL